MNHVLQSTTNLKESPFLPGVNLGDDAVVGVQFLEFSISLGVHWCRSKKHAEQVQKAFKDWKSDIKNMRNPFSMSKQLHSRKKSDTRNIKYEIINQKKVPRSFITFLRERGL